LTPASTISLSKIVLPGYQPRRYFDPEAMQSLVESVQQDGILQAILVRPLKGQYELIAGERRYHAAKTVGLTEIPALVRDLSDVKVHQYRLTENLQREDLNPLEEMEGVLAFLQLKLDRDQESVISLFNQLANAKRGFTDNVVRKEEQDLIEGIFNQVGRFSVESFRTHRLPLLKMPEEIKEALRKGQIHYTNAKEITKLKETSARKQLLEASIEQKLSLKQIRQWIKDLQSSSNQQTSDELAERFRSTYLNAKSETFRPQRRIIPLRFKVSK
jgi:ParB family chromosome partitioning protein